jgi:hypothetical protein
MKLDNELEAFFMQMSMVNRSVLLFRLT